MHTYNILTAMCVSVALHYQRHSVGLACWQACLQAKHLATASNQLAFESQLCKVAESIKNERHGDCIDPHACTPPDQTPA